MSADPMIDQPPEAQHVSDSEHPPIRGLRAMAAVRWILLALVALVALGTWWSVIASEPSGDGRPDHYYCPMHPQIRAPEPGTCPICYMSLEPIPEHSSHAPPAADAGAPDPGSDRAQLVPVMLTIERRQRAGIAVVPARRVTLEGSERWPASIEANEGARGEVRVRAGAFVERIAIRQSNVRVRAGQTLAWVYSPEILRAQEELLVAHRWAASDGAASAAAAGRERLALLGMSASDVEAMLASGRSRRTIPVRAPIGGYVTRFEAVVGSYVTPEVLLYEITDLSRVRVVATPFVGDLSWLAPGAAARFEPRDGGPPVPVTLDSIEPALTEGTRALRVRFTADGSALRLGDIGEVIIPRPAREALVIPRDGVIDTGTERYVFVESSEGVFEARSVQLGELEGEQRIVIAGVDAGERVVARGAFLLDSESRLRAALAPAMNDAGGSR